MNDKVHVIGIGPGGEGFMTPAAVKLIEQCDVLVGGKRNLELFSGLEKENIVIGNKLEDITLYISNNYRLKKIGVIVTGDPGVFSMTEYLKKTLAGVELEVVPGISSLQYLCSKLNVGWDDSRIISLHGRVLEDWTGIVRSSKKTLIFTGGSYKTQRVCRELFDNNLDVTVHVGENLSYPNERIVSGSPSEIGKMSFEDLSIMLVEQKNCFKVNSSPWGYRTPGIPDSEFIRGEIPMTKEEVRSVVLSKLRLRSDSVVYDVGAGSGSVSVECALYCPLGHVYAIEKNPLGAELIVNNARKFMLKNVTVVLRDASEVLLDYPEPDRVFIGGTGGKMGEILKQIKGMSKSIRVVIDTITVESTYEALQGLESMGFENIEIVNVTVSKGKAVGGKHLMQAQNPVYIISADKGDIK